MIGDTLTLRMEHIGWIPLNEDGSPYRSVTRSSYHTRTEPLKIYRSAKRARNYSPVGKCKQVTLVDVD